MTTSLATPKIPNQVRRRGPRALAALAAAVLVAGLAACTPAPAPSPTATAIEIPDTSVGAQAQWVLDEINAESVVDEAEFEEHFDPIMFEELSVADLRDVFVQLQSGRPWTATEYDGTETEARVRIESTSPYDMTVSVAEDGRMNGLYFGMPQPDRTPAASWDDLRTELDEAPYEVSLVVSGGDDAAVEIGDAVLSPIGSIFKLYVLGAVVDAVAAGTLTWESPLTIDAEVRSLPSGEMQDLPDGATVTVLEAATKMISISDNTATDALIRAVGRDAVLAAMADMGHSEPAVNTPFAATREFFWIGWGDEELRQQWTDADGDAAAREAVIADVPAGPPAIETFDPTTPVWQSGIDWFATPDDIARAHLALQERATTDAGEPVRGILSENPGIEAADDWTYVGFKGGSSVGVMAGSWYLEREGADPVVLTVFARSDDPAAVADPAIVFAPAEDAARLLLEE
ncbi:MAG: Cpe/LpqF family protein [Microbacteriaceae bacterium]